MVPRCQALQMLGTGRDAARGARAAALLSRLWSAGGGEGEECTCNMGDLGLTPGLGRSPGEGNGYPLQYSVKAGAVRNLRQELDS